MITERKPGSQAQGISQIQKGAAAVGLLLVLLGLLGFIPGITQPYGELRFATDSSTAELFGIFQVSVPHNIIHLLSGVAGLICARTPLRARNYLLVAGICYLVLFLYGILIFRRTEFDFIPINNPDNILHLLVGTRHDRDVYPAGLWARLAQDNPGRQGGDLDRRSEQAILGLLQLLLGSNGCGRMKAVPMSSRISAAEGYRLEGWDDQRSSCVSRRPLD